MRVLLCKDNFLNSEKCDLQHKPVISWKSIQLLKGWRGLEKNLCGLKRRWFGRSMKSLKTHEAKLNKSAISQSVWPKGQQSIPIQVAWQPGYPSGLHLRKHMPLSPCILEANHHSEFCVAQMQFKGIRCLLAWAGQSAAKNIFV